MDSPTHLYFLGSNELLLARETSSTDRHKCHAHLAQAVEALGRACEKLQEEVNQFINNNDASNQTIEMDLQNNCVTKKKHKQRAMYALAKAQCYYGAALVKQYTEVVEVIEKKVKKTIHHEEHEQEHEQEQEQEQEADAQICDDDLDLALDVVQSARAYFANLYWNFDQAFCTKYESDVLGTIHKDDLIDVETDTTPADATDEHEGKNSQKHHEQEQHKEPYPPLIITAKVVGLELDFCHYHLGMRLAEEERFTEAYAELQTALELRMRYLPPFSTDIAVCLMHMGMFALFDSKSGRALHCYRETARVYNYRLQKLANKVAGEQLFSIPATYEAVLQAKRDAKEANANSDGGGIGETIIYSQETRKAMELLSQRQLSKDDRTDVDECIDLLKEMEERAIDIESEIRGEFDRVAAVKQAVAAGVTNKTTIGFGNSSSSLCSTSNATSHSSASLTNDTSFDKSTFNGESVLLSVKRKTPIKELVSDAAPPTQQSVNILTAKE